jgi:hypothetical protein
VPDLPVLLLSDQEPGQLLAQLGQPLAHQAQAGDDVANLVRAAQLAAAVRQMVQRADSFGGLSGDLARSHRAGQLGHWPVSSGLGAGTCSGICLLGGYAARDREGRTGRHLTKSVHQYDT